MTQKSFEQGRSMVEMLGVLAVIGVLSVTGIAGYSTAMRSHRVNEMMNATSMLYVMASAQNQGTGADLNYNTLGTLNGATLLYTASTKTISMTVADVKDCEMVKNRLGDKATGNCSGANSVLTVTLGETEPEIEQDPCSQCTSSYNPMAGYSCSGTNCSNCVPPWQAVNGTPCISLENCNHVCIGACFDNTSDSGAFPSCCSSGAPGTKKGC